MTGQATGGQSDLCKHFAEVCTNTYELTPISAADVQRLGALNIPGQIVLNGMPSGDSSFAGNEPEQRYVFKTSSTIFRWYRTLHAFLGPAPHSQHELPPLVDRLSLIIGLRSARRSRELAR